MDKYRQAERAHQATQRGIQLAKERCDAALVAFQRGTRRGFRELSLVPFEGEKLSIEQLCAACGLRYEDGKVHSPPKPQELRRAA